MFTKSSKCESHTCVEVDFVKSSKCHEMECVEVCATNTVVFVRDGKEDFAAPWLKFSPAAWKSFVGSL